MESGILYGNYPDSRFLLIANIYINKNTCVYLCVCMCMHVYMCVYVCVRVFV